MSNNNAILEIKRRLNILDIVGRYVELRRMGPRHVAPCPFHQETKPSFSVNEEEGLFYCFGCQAAGDIFAFYSRINGLDFRECLEQLAEEAGVELEKFKPIDGVKKNQDSTERKQILKMHEFAAKHFANNLQSETGKSCRIYLEKRGISAEMIKDFELGYSLPSWNDLTNAFRKAGFNERLAVKASLLGKSDKTNNFYDRFRGRLMFPIRNLSGQVIAFGGRIIGDEDEAKYINSGDSPIYKKGEHLYNLFQARRAISHGASGMITEGYMDVLSLHQYGYKTAFGVLGTALTPEQVKRISGFTSKIELLFDGDKPGRKAALKACEMFLTKGMSCKVILLPDGEDIDSVLRDKGVEFFEKLRDKSPNGIQFCINYLRDLSKREAIDFTKNFLKQTLPELLSEYISAFSTGLNLTEAEIRGQIQINKQEKNVVQKPVSQSVDTLDKQIMTFAVRYPKALDKLRNIGAHLELSSTWAKNLWQKLEENPGIEFLDERDKRFWVLCRSGNVPPLNNEAGELDAIVGVLKVKQRIANASAMSMVLSQAGNDPEADLAYLKALTSVLAKRD